MLYFVFRRVVQTSIAIVFVAVLAFGLARLAGDPVPLLMSSQATQADVELLRAQLGLDRSIPVQFVDFIAHALQGNFGNSFRYKENALQLVLGRIPPTAYLAGLSMLIAILVGVPMGIVASLKRGSLADIVVRACAAVGQAMPVFWLGLMLILVFAVHLRWTPTSGYGSAANFILPSLTLGLISAASIARLTRSSMLDVLQSDFIKLERLCGLPHWLIVLKHALRNASAPIFTFMALQLGALFGGAVVTEQIFAWPGFGQLILNAIRFRDFPVIQASVLVTATFFLAVNLLVDILYRALDPRVRL